MLDGYVDNLHFDEAWLPHAAFHPFYGTYHAMGKKRAQPPKTAVVYSTQSIHKLLAGISQASHVLVQDSQTVKLDRRLFNEAYLMHTSTSPQYSIIASCDVAAAMMEPPGGTALVEESIMLRHWTSAAPCARWTRNTARTGGSRSGARTNWWTKASAAPPTGSSRANPKAMPRPTGTALARWPPASTCWTRSRPPSSRRAWT